jgi:hypothetical protein
MVAIIINLIFVGGCNLGRVADNGGNLNPQEEIQHLLQSLESDNAITVKVVDHNPDHFYGAFELFVEQPVDHNDPSKGTFTQKLYLNHKSFDSPMIFNINGYSVPNNNFVSELVPWLDANFIHIEHRYFADSRPAELDYTFLTIQQAAADHHRIIERLKEIYSGKWISTGISKGGQATIFHRSLYPEDVDVSIPYVAPVNLDVEDKRLVEFLDNVGTAECRANILEFQRAILSDYGAALASFKIRATNDNLSFSMGWDKAFELSVLEYEFAYWQWTGGEGCENIPGMEADLNSLMDELFKIDAPGFFTNASVDYFFPFFYQAYHELGMYGYAVDSLEGYLKQYKTYVNNYYTFIPEWIDVEYNPETLENVYEFIQNRGNEFIYVYGENDAWSATAFVANEELTNSVTLFKENGSHQTRINDLSSSQKKLVFDKLEEWLDIDIP